MSYPAQCHQNTVVPFSANVLFQPWKHLNSFDYAKYIYKHFKLVEVKLGSPQHWGDWGSNAPGAGPGNVYEVLDLHDDYVLINGVELFAEGHDQAVLPDDAPPAYVWSRYLRSHTEHVRPLLLNWQHHLERQSTPRQHGRLRPTNVSHSHAIVLTAFRHNYWHMILNANHYAKFIYKWGKTAVFGRGAQDEIGNWGFLGAQPDFLNQTFVVLSQENSFVLVNRAIVIEGAIGIDSFHDPVWIWSRFLRIQSVVAFPRKINWNHVWEPQRQPPPPNGYTYLRPPLNLEE